GPSSGAPRRPTRRLSDPLPRWRALGNTVLVVEHDEEPTRAAAHVIALGPGAGELGGYVVATGTPPEITADPKSLTGRYLAGDLRIPLPLIRRPGSGKWLVIHGAREHNLKGRPARIPPPTLPSLT